MRMLINLLKTMIRVCKVTFFLILVISNLFFLNRSVLLRY